MIAQIGSVVRSQLELKVTKLREYDEMTLTPRHAFKAVTSSRSDGNPPLIIRIISSGKIFNKLSILNFLSVSRTIHLIHIQAP